MSITTVFRSRLRPGAHEAYGPAAQAMVALVATMDGFEGQWFYTNGDERVTIVRFRDWASHRAWAEHPEHREAQRRGIEEFYDFYELSVGEDAVHHVFDKMDQ